jgi:peptidoglycan-associated lipoprotein
MNRKDPTQILLWAGLALLAVLLIVGCAKKAPVVEEPPPPPPVVVPDTAGQAAREAAEREAAERVRREAEERARLAAEQAAKSSLQIVYFDFDKYNLRSDAQSAADFNAGVLQEYTGWSILIEGHCDERGTDEYNLALGERRANTVKDYFINYGLDAPRFSIVSYGEERPADPGHNEDAWAKNRRAVLVIQ